MKKIHILLLPKDFIDTDFTNSADCPLARAVKRHFKCNDVGVDHEFVDIYDDKYQGKIFKINEDFKYDDYLFVKEQYANDPDMEKARYFVTLIPK